MKKLQRQFEVVLEMTGSQEKQHGRNQIAL